MSRVALVLRSLALLAFTVPVSAAVARPAPQTHASVDSSAPISAVRQHVSGDLYHYQFDLRVGSTPNAVVRIHRVVREVSPWVPRPSKHAVMLLHGDFSNFITNFLPTLGNPASSAPGMAPYLVSKGIDVWGVDRRWTLPGLDGDTSDFGGMSVKQEIGDINVALAFARLSRTLTDGDSRPIVLGGFSHGAELTYAYAAADGRHISGIAPMDIYYDIAPEDSALRDAACASAAGERDAVAQGMTDSDNKFFIKLGTYDRSAPDGKDVYPPYTNRQTLYLVVGQTYAIGVTYTPFYHLAAPVLDADGNVSALRESSEDAISAWFAGATPHQSMLEAADLDTIWCGTEPRAELSNIHVPLFYLGAAGGFGAYGLYSTTRVSSTDVTTHIVHRFGPDRVAEDFGHGDLLFAADAPTLAWAPLATWLLAH